MLLSKRFAPAVTALIVSGLSIPSAYAIGVATSPADEAARSAQQSECSSAGTSDENTCRNLAEGAQPAQPGPAIAVGTVAAQAESEPISAKTVRISWVPAPGGPAATNYRVIATWPCSTPGGCSNTYYPDPTQTSIVVPVNHNPTTYFVVPQNAAGFGPASPASSPVVHSGVPLAPAAPTVVPES